MPSGKVHDSIALISIFPAFLAGKYLLKLDFTGIMIFTFAVIFSQLMFGPDLDNKSIQYKRWGIFKWIWRPYSKIFSHRSSFSHGLILGPAIRIIYLVFVLFLIFTTINFLICKYFNINLFFLALPYLYYLYMHINSNYMVSCLAVIIAGIFVGAAIHTFTDKISSFFKNIL